MQRSFIRNIPRERAFCNRYFRAQTPSRRDTIKMARSRPPSPSPGCVFEPPSFRIRRLTPSTPPPSTLTAAGQGEEGHQEEADAQVLDRLQPTRRRWHHGRGVLCTRATPCIPPFLFAATGGRSARVAFGGVALLGRAACAAAIWSFSLRSSGGSGCCSPRQRRSSSQAAAAAIARPSFAKEAVWPLLPLAAARWLALRLSVLCSARFPRTP